MVSRGSATISAKPVLGAGLLGLGTVMLLSNATFLAVTQESSADILFSPHAYFAVASKLLVSFWPLGLVAAGAVLLLQYSKGKRGRAEARV